LHQNVIDVESIDVKTPQQPPGRRKEKKEEEEKEKGKKESKEERERKAELVESIKTGSLDKLRDVIARGVKLDVKLENGHSPLHAAVLGDFPDLVRELLKKGLSVHEVDDANSTPLFYAQSYKVAQILLQHGANGDFVDNTGKTAYDTLVSLPLPLPPLSLSLSLPSPSPLPLPPSLLLSLFVFFPYCYLV
jgi:ankyrin repeat protein